ncbi:MAG: type 3 dihydrofolate reductase [Glaciecola sp.]
MIAAMANNRIIGKDNQMPWHLPADLKHFKSVTMGKPVIMGRRTYDSIGRALPGRLNIVISTNAELSLNDATVAQSCEQALQIAKAAYNEVMIIGGGTIYQHFLPQADTLYLTHIDLEVDGDTQFPDYHSHGKWHTLASEKHLSDSKNAHNYTFVTLTRS